MGITPTEGMKLTRLLLELKCPVIKTWVSNDDHEYIVAIDEEGNRFEIKCYPNKVG